MMNIDEVCIWLIDDQALRRAGLARVIEPWARQNGYSLVEADSIEAAGAANGRNGGSRGKQVCILACGDRIGEEALADAVSRLGDALGEAAVVLLAEIHSKAEVIAAIRIGACGILTFDMGPEQALSALEFILDGGAYFPRCQNWQDQSARPDRDVLEDTSLQRLPAGREAGSDRTKADLTPRQADVLASLQVGNSNKAIARELNMAESTVKIHVRQILKKFGAANRTQVALAASSFRRGESRVT